MQHMVIQYNRYEVPNINNHEVQIRTTARALSCTHLLLRTSDRMMMVDSSPWKLSTVATRTESLRLSRLMSAGEFVLSPETKLTLCSTIRTTQYSTAQRSAASASHSRAEQSTAEHSTAQQSTAQHSTAQHSTAQHSTAQHSTAQHSTAQHSTAQHSTAQHSTAHSKGHL